MKLDPTKMKDWEIAEAAEETLRPAAELAAELGLESGEWTPYGDVLAKVDVTKVLKRLGEKKRAKYIDVTAITPTALGEGKTTTTLGLVEGLGRLGKKVIGCQGQRGGRRPRASRSAHEPLARPHRRHRRDHERE